MATMRLGLVSLYWNGCTSKSSKQLVNSYASITDNECQNTICVQEYQPNNTVNTKSNRRGKTNTKLSSSTVDFSLNIYNTGRDILVFSLLQTFICMNMIYIMLHVRSRSLCLMKSAVYNE